MQDTHPRHAALLEETLREAAASGYAIMGKLIVALRRSAQYRVATVADRRERDMFTDSVRLLSKHEMALREGYSAALSEQFGPDAASAKTMVPGIADIQFDLLELMDDELVQDSVNLARALQKVMLVADTSVAELNILVCGMLGLPVVRPERNPLRPESYIIALKNTVERLPVPAAIRADWLAGMEDGLGAELRDVYARLLTKLRGLNIEPAGFVLGAGSSADRPRSADVGKSLDDMDPYGAPGSPQREARIAQELAPPKRNTADPELLNLDRLRKLLSGELEDGHSNNRIAAFAKEFERRFEPSSWGHSGLHSHADFSVTVPAAFEALTEMKQVERVVQRLEQRRDGIPLPAELQSLEALRGEIRAGAQGVSQALSLEVVNLMVDNIANDPRLLEPVQKLVRKIEPALMRLVLVDPRVFTDKQHVARRLVLEMTQRSLAFKTQDSEGFAAFVQEVDAAITPLCQAVIEGPELFEDALRELQMRWQHVDERQTRTRSTAVRVLEKAEQRNLLAERIARKIDAHPDATKMPPVVLNFLCGPWAQVIAQARMAGGTGSASADKYEALMSALLWSVHPDLPHKNITKLTKLVPPLLSTLREGLETIQYPAQKISAFLEALMGLHQVAFRAVQRNAEAQAQSAAKEVTPSRMPQRTNPVEYGNPWVAPAEAMQSNFMDVPDDAAPALAQTVHATVPVIATHGAGGLPLGAWVELLTKGEWVRTQLTWASPHGTLFLFTSASGSTQSMTRRTHDKLVAVGQLRVISAQSVVDGALDAVAQRAMKNSVDSPSLSLDTRR